jgi:hypothetical protein
LLPSGAPESVSNMLPTKRASGPRAACARRSSYEHLSVIREVGERAAVQETDGHVPAAIAENPSHREPRCLPQGDGGSPTSDSSIARPISGPCTSLGVRLPPATGGRVPRDSTGCSGGERGASAARSSAGPVSRRSTVQHAALHVLPSGATEPSAARPLGRPTTSQAQRSRPVRAGA